MSQSTVIQGKTGNATTQAPRIDSRTHTLQTIEYEHHEVHAGSMYHAEHNASGGAGTRAIISFKTPNTTKWAHAVFEVRSNVESIYQLQEAASMGTGTGASYAPRNHDRNSTKTTTLKNTSLGTDGTAGYVTVGCDYSGSTLTLFSTQIGSGKEGGKPVGMTNGY